MGKPQNDPATPEPQPVEPTTPEPPIEPTPEPQPEPTAGALPNPEVNPNGSLAALQKAYLLGLREGRRQAKQKPDPKRLEGDGGWIFPED